MLLLKDSLCKIPLIATNLMPLLWYFVVFLHFNPSISFYLLNHEHQFWTSLLIFFISAVCPLTLLPQVTNIQNIVSILAQHSVYGISFYLDINSYHIRFHPILAHPNHHSYLTISLPPVGLLFLLWCTSSHGLFFTVVYCMWGAFLEIKWFKPTWTHLCFAGFHPK